MEVKTQVGSNIRSAMTILPELRAGQVITELSSAIHEAVSAVRENNKAATVTLTIKIAPLASDRVVESPISISADVESKLPRKGPEATIFFVDEGGNPSRDVQRKQPDLAFGVVQPSTSTGD